MAARRRRTKRTHGEVDLSIALLDLLSSGLGAMILLFILMAVMDHQGNRRSSFEEGLPLDLDPIEAMRAASEELVRPALFELRLRTNVASPPPGDWLVLLQSNVPVRLSRGPNRGDDQVYFLRVDDLSPGTFMTFDLQCKADARVTPRGLSAYASDAPPINASINSSITFDGTEFVASQLMTPRTPEASARELRP